MKSIGPCMRRHIVAKLARRTGETPLLEGVRQGLTVHVGSNPDALQASIIEHVAMLTLPRLSKTSYTLHNVYDRVA